MQYRHQSSSMSFHPLTKIFIPCACANAHTTGSTCILLHFAYMSLHPSSMSVPVFACCLSVSLASTTRERLTAPQTAVQTRPTMTTVASKGGSLFLWQIYWGNLIAEGASVLIRTCPLQMASEFAIEPTSTHSLYGRTSIYPWGRLCIITYYADVYIAGIDDRQQLVRRNGHRPCKSNRNATGRRWDCIRTTLSIRERADELTGSEHYTRLTWTEQSISRCTHYTRIAMIS